MVDRVHGGDVCQQGLGCADVGSSLLSANVLLSGLQSHSVAHVALGVLRDTDDSSRHFSDIGLLGGEETRVGPTEAHRHTESLRGAEAKVRAHLSGWLGDSQGQQVRGHDLDSVLLQAVELVEEISEISQYAIFVRRLHQDAAVLLRFVLIAQELLIAAHDNLNIQVVGPGLDDCDRRREDVLVDEEFLLLAIVDVICHVEGLAARASLVEQRSIAEV